MESTKLGSGDTNNCEKSLSSAAIDEPSTCELPNIIVNEESIGQLDCIPQLIDNNDAKLKERITHCKNIIDSLKFELNEEKSKLEMESKTENLLENVAKIVSPVNQDRSTHILNTDLSFSCNMYSACIDSKLNCDENLIQYEKQLQKYQDTLNMAQIEKKNAIRKQMLAKAYKLKLLEIENQCNVELLRVKQSLQCLEPLKIIANKWKSNPDNDVNSYNLIPRFPELNTYSGTEDSPPTNLDTKISIGECEDCEEN